jgi:hypothetical protein
MVSYTGSVPDRCTCGATLPDDARFCHKCGKPQYDYPATEPEPEPEAPPPLPVAAGRVEEAEVGFRNKAAVRISLFTTLGACVLIAFPMPPVVELLWIAFVFFSAGFVSAFVYSRRTRRAITPRSGLRLGWMTGLFSFTIVAALTIASLLNLSELREQMSRDPNYRAAAPLLSDPGFMVAALVLGLLLLFILFTLLSVAGGALCAKFLEKD